MKSSKSKEKVQSPRSKNRNTSPSQLNLSPRSRQLRGRRLSYVGFKSTSPNSKREGSPFSKHERSFSTLYSKFMQHQTYSENH